MKESQQKFEALFQFASMGILVANEKAEIVLVNNYLLWQFGYEDQDELIGKSIEELIPRRYHPAHVHHRDNYNKHPKPRPMGLGKDLFAEKKDRSEFPVEISLSNYTTSEGSFTIAFITDITKRKEYENAVLQQKQQLADINAKIAGLNNELEQKVQLRTQQLEHTLVELEKSKDELTRALSKEKDLSDLKSRFVSMASHEFRTPLSTILSSASLVAKYTETEEQDKRDKHVQRIKSSVNNLTNLLNEFLSIGKIEDGKVISNNTDFNVKELITGLCIEMEALAKPGQQIVQGHKGKETIILDPGLLRNIIMNMLSNAIKFSGENAVIEVKTTVTDKEVRIIVKDNGMGISADDQEHLFERFFRGANVINIQGTGLGLHIVAKYIELMDGHIEFKSELEKGTEFIITFKIA